MLKYLKCYLRYSEKNQSRNLLFSYNFIILSRSVLKGNQYLYKETVRARGRFQLCTVLCSRSSSAAGVSLCSTRSFCWE